VAAFLFGENNMNSERTGERRDNPPIRVRIDAFKQHRRNTLIGFVDITLVDIGMSIRGCTIHAKNNTRWCGLPAREFTSNEGKKWVPIIDFENHDDRRALYDGVLSAYDEYVGAGAQAAAAPSGRKQ
jgi:hypothetical protein